MTITVEDGSGVTDANSYATRAELVDYAALKGIVLPVVDADKDVLLINAAEFLEAQNFIGTKASFEQALQWPRYGAAVDGYTIYRTEIPARLKKAQLQLALDNIDTPLMTTVIPSAKGAVIEETVSGAVTVRYAAPGTTLTSPVFTVAMSYLRPLLRSLAQATVRRA